MLTAAMAASALIGGAYATLDLIYFVVGWSFVGLLILLLLSTVGEALRIHFTRAETQTLPPVNLETAQAPHSTLFSLRNTWLPWIQLSTVWVDATGQLFPCALSWKSRRRFSLGAILDEHIVFEQRTWLTQAQRWIQCEDVFGLCRITLRRPFNQTWCVVPHMKGLERVDVPKRLVIGEDESSPTGKPQGDRIDLRPYAPGDPAKTIHWKVYAKTGHLTVRAQERAQTVATTVFVYFWPSKDDEASAALCRKVIETLQQTVRVNYTAVPAWSFSISTEMQSTSDLATAMQMIAASRCTEGEKTPKASLAQNVVERSQDSQLLCVVPPHPNPGLIAEITEALVNTDPSHADIWTAVDSVVTVADVLDRLSKLLNKDIKVYVRR